MTSENPYREIHKFHLKMKEEYKAKHIEAEEGCKYWERKADEYDKLLQNLPEVQQ